MIPLDPPESPYRGLVESATDIIYSTDAEGHFVLYNPQAEVKLGYTREELIGRHYLTLVRPDHRESVRRYYGRQFALGIRSTYREIPAVAKDGTVVWLGKSAQLVTQNGKVVGFHVVARDISRRRRHEALARGQRAVLEMIARRAPLGACLNRLCSLVEELRGGWCSFLIRQGGRLHSMAGPSLPDFYQLAVDGMEIAPGSGSCGSAAFAGQTVVSENVMEDPAWRAFRSLAERVGISAAWSTPIFGDGEVLGTIALYDPKPGSPGEDDIEIIDICAGLAQIAIERNREEERIQSLVAQRTAELELAQEQLVRVRQLEGVGRLAAGLAHEFNNWLTVIQLYCEQLAHPPMTDAGRAVQEIRLAAQRASALTRQLLAVGRTQELRPRMLDCNCLIHGLGPMLRALLGSGVEVLIETGPVPAIARLDESQFEQVLVNLALNARDAMPAGGTFTVRSLAEGTRAVMEVSDTGAGMDSETLARVFEPFFTTKGPGRGSGLGLATVYGVVRQSGGEITAWSEPGHGSRFRISLPLVVPETTAVDDEQTQIPRGSGETVLVVDDDMNVRRLVASLLRRLDYDVLEAADGPEAIQLSSNAVRTVQLLLTDIALPGIDGRELARELCRANGGPKVLFMSGHALPETGEPSLSKPFSAKMLADKVRSVLAVPGARQ